MMLSPVWFKKPTLLWWWIPVIFVSVWTGIDSGYGGALMEALSSENGMLEWLQFFLMAIAFGGCLYQLSKLDVKTYPWLAAWFAVAALGCFFIGGEEISWGQWIFYWDTPAAFTALNDQNETNLHNMSSWLDQKPQALLEIGVIMGGLILPLLMRFRPSVLPSFVKNVTPASHAIFLVAIYLFVKLNWLFNHAFGIRIYSRASELIELLVYYFVAIYVCEFAAAPFRKKVNRRS